MLQRQDQKRTSTSFFQSIQGKLVILLLIVILPLILMQVYLYHQRFQERRAGELESNLEIARSIGKNFEAYVQDVLHQEQAIGLALTSSNFSPEERDRYIDKLKAESPTFLNVLWADPQGIVLSSHLPNLVGMSLNDREYFTRIVDGRDWTISDLHRAKSTGEPAFAIARAIRDSQEKLLGVVVASIIPEKLWDVLGIERSQGAGISILDSKGILVCRFPVISYTWEQRDWLSAYPEIGGALNRKDVLISLMSKLLGMRRLVAFTPIRSIGWVAAASRAEDDAMASIRASLLPNTVIFLLFTVGAFGTALAFSRRISVAISKLRDRAAIIGRGDTPDGLDFSGTTELRELAESLDKMAAGIRKREMERAHSEELARESEAKVKSILRAAPVGIGMTLDRVILEANDSLTQITGYSRDELIGTDGIKLYPDRAEYDWVGWEKYVQIAKKGTGTVETRWKSKDGNIKNILLSFTPLDLANPAAGFTFTALDITERKKADNQLKADLAALTRMHRLSGRMLDEAGLTPLLQDIMDAAAEMVNAEMGTLQLFDGHCLHIVAARGHTREFLDFFASTENKASVFGEAARQGTRVTVPDVETSPLFAGTPSLTVMRNSGIRAVQSTPMISRTGELLGILTTQWKETHTPDEHDLRRIDLLARQAADLIEHAKGEQELRKSRDELELRVLERTEQLEKANEELRQIPSKLIYAQEDERKRLAVELHDSIGQTLAALKFRIELIFETLRKDEKESALCAIEDFVPVLQRSIDETRAIYMGLRPKMLEDFGVIAALKWFREEMLKLYPERHIEMDITIGEEEIPLYLHIPIFRVAQEALNNVAKHSKSEWVDLSLSRNGDSINLMVSDDGIGMEVDQILHNSTARSLGLTSMNERAEMFGGSFSIESTPGEGTIVKACWPAAAVSTVSCK